MRKTPRYAFPHSYRTQHISDLRAHLLSRFSIYTKQHELLRELSRKSDCVIVGRCADYILREQKPVRIFAYADMESRIKRCMERRPEDEHLTEAQMKKRIAEIDRSRAKYYAFFSEQKWGARENYDLLVNTSGADIKSCPLPFALIWKPCLNKICISVIAAHPVLGNRVCCFL